MASGESLGPKSKKLRRDCQPRQCVQEDNTEHTEGNIFVSCHRNRGLITRLQEACITLEGLNQQSNFGVAFCKIVESNARSSNLFSLATCQCQLVFLKEEGTAYALSHLFKKGIQILKSYINNPDSVPREKGSRLALEQLLTFMSKDLKEAESSLTDLPDDMTLSDWNLQISHHLLSKLSFCTQYTIDDQSSVNLPLTCPCPCRQLITGVYRDTSIGLPEGWHGRLDVIVNEVPVIITTEDLSQSPESSVNDVPTELRAAKELPPSCTRQMRSEAILFSFLQQKRHPDLENFLIPSVAVSKEQVAFCFYDSENDLLLQTPPIGLFDESKVYLRRATVLALWLVLNYKYLCCGVPEKLRRPKYSAEFFTQVGSQLDDYRNRVESPCHGIAEKWWGIDMIVDSDQDSE